MKLYNITMRLNRLEMLNQMIRLHIIGTGSKVENELQDHLIKGSIDEYKRQASILGLNINQTGIERRARFIVSQDYHNAHFSDRVWRDTRELSRRIERNIESVVIQGKNPREFAKKLRDLVSKDIKNITNATERLAYTESGRVWIQTQIEAYKDGGYEYLEIMTEPTACRHCSPHNGDIVKLSEAVEGDNIPLWHPRCRCTTVAHFKEENRENSESSGYDDNVSTYISGAITDTDSQEAIIRYKSPESYKINEKLYKNIKLNDKEKEFVENLDRALKKMPNYEGDLVRDLYFADNVALNEFVKSHKVGDVKEYASYISTTKSNSYNEAANVRLYINNSKMGKDISSIGLDEEEVLYQRNSKFLVNSIRKSSKTTEIILKELSNE